METEEEWKYVKDLAKDKKRRRWFIGLQNVSESRKWCWLSDNTSCINKTLSSPSSWRWNTGEPNNFNTEKCVEMWTDCGKYNNVECEKEKYDDDPGYICENYKSE